MILQNEVNYSICSYTFFKIDERTTIFFQKYNVGTKINVNFEIVNGMQNRLKN